MKDAEEVYATRPMFKVRMQGAPPPRGWVLRYMSGAEEKDDIKPGYLLSKWWIDKEGFANFDFSPEPTDMVAFQNEAYTDGVAEFLRQHVGLEIQKFKVG
jgi:hypothetical protein